MGVLNFLVFILCSTLISAEEFVPVLLWTTQTVSNPDQGFPGLSRLSTEEFSERLSKKVEVEKPVIFVFMEENLSVEDFSWRDVDGNGAYPSLQNVTKASHGMTFLPSVHNPYRALKKLKELGYSWELYNGDLSSSNDKVIWLVKLKEPEFTENRPDMLKSHDQQMAKIYNKALHSDSNVLALYTGHHNSWIEADIEYNRVKREDPPPTPDSNILVLNSSIVLMTVEKPIILVNKDGTFNLTNSIADQTNEPKENSLIFDVTLRGDDPAKKFEIDFYFIGVEGGSWVLSHATVDENKAAKLIPDANIYGPSQWSYYCSQSITFTYKDKDDVISITLNNLQVQPYYNKEKQQFGPPIDCIPYFSTGIWSGIFIVFLLALVISWGVIMIMDINTMDRFDDPKGKTITISATD